ncbi:MAG: hypothetical protein EOM05_08545, partial [Clostridia bacterium]|nr:hypothetical protein [Clostridia bacterium]
MKKRKIVLSVTLVLAILLTIIPMSFLANADGEIEISSYADLQKIGKESGYPLNGSYKLTGDIVVDVADTEFIPIGTEKENFTGSFDGQNYQISGIKITGTNTEAISDVGLFGYVGEGASISNLKVSDAQFVNIDESDVKTIGLIAGYNMGTIENCAAAKSENLIEINLSSTVVGGIVGYNDGSILKCYNTSDLSVTTLTAFTSLQ